VRSKDRDFIWVDLQGVESEMEAVSRAVYQLGMRKQVRAWDRKGQEHSCVVHCSKHRPFSAY
jgi:hypothetical protein